MESILPAAVGVARNVPETISPRLEEEFPLDFLQQQKEPHGHQAPQKGGSFGEELSHEGSRGHININNTAKN